MKGQTKWAVIVLFLLANIHWAHSKTINTISPGEWYQSVIWEGGFVPATSDTIVVRHCVSIKSPFVLDHNVLIIEAMGKLCCSDVLTINKGSKIYNYGNLAALKFYVNDTIINYSSGNIHSTYLLVNEYFYSSGQIVLNDKLNCLSCNPPSPVITQSQDGILISNTSGKEYQWQVGGEVLDVNSISLSPKISGIYKMRVKGENGLFSEYSNELQIIISNIVENPKEEITIYPNPTDNILKIKFGDVPEDKVHINIIDAAGKLIISDKTRIDKFSNISIDVSDYCEGIYFIRIKAGEELITKKFQVH